MITLPFNYNGIEYSALIHEKYFADKKEYRITIMNGELEQLLYGDHILVEEDGVIRAMHTPVGAKRKLVSQLTNSLNEYMERNHVF